MLSQSDLTAIGKLLDKKLTKQKKDILSEMDKKLAAQASHILLGVADTLAKGVLPLIDDHEKRLEKLETKVGISSPTS